MTLMAWNSDLLDKINGLPFVAEEFAVNADEEASDPEDEENVDEVIVLVLFICGKGKWEWEYESDQEGSPEVPFLELLDCLVSISGQHKQNILDLHANGDNFLFLHK